MCIQLNHCKPTLIDFPTFFAAGKTVYDLTISTLMMTAVMHWSVESVEDCASASTSQDVAEVNDNISESAKGAKSLECRVCQRKFFSKLTLTEHQARHEGRMLYSCTICKRQFRQKSGHWRHMKAKHIPDKPKKRYPCPKCNKDFSRSTYMKAHLASHDESQRGRFTCEVCQRTFLQKSDLSRHQKTHDKQQSFKCTTCKRDFSSLASQKRHEKEHDPAGKAPCVHCRATFTRSYKLKEHVAKFHSGAVLFKPLLPKESSSQTTSAPRMERELLSQHCDNSAALQRTDRCTTDGLPTQAKGDSLLRQTLATLVDVAPMNTSEICSSSELNGNPGQLQGHHSSSGTRATEFGASGLWRQQTRGDILQCLAEVPQIELNDCNFGAASRANFVSHFDFLSRPCYD
ncbi:hypothetical protein MRX96_032290 [Rhipicephalus microplus]